MTSSSGPLEVALPAVPRSGGHARNAVREFVGQADREAMSDDAAIVVSELVANAVQHSSGPIRLRLSWEREDLRIEVDDANRAPPTVRQTSATGVSGRGLHIVDALADEWGFDIAPAGKSVWARLQSPALTNPGW